MTKILIVNDIAIVNKFHKHNLESEGFVVDTVLTGTEGIRLANENRYDLILLDYQLPDLNGSEVCKAIKACAGNAGVPVHFISALDKEKLNQVIAETGAQGYLDMTGEIGALAGRIRELIK